MTTKVSLVRMHILGAALLVPLLIAIGLPRVNADRQGRKDGREASAQQLAAADKGNGA